MDKKHYKMRTTNEIIYDDYVLNGSSDECHRNGILGNCGKNCPIFGTNEDCPSILDEHEKAIADDTEITVKWLWLRGWFFGAIVGCLAIVWALVIRWWLS